MMNNLRTRRNLISLDGMDGTGKTSAINVINAYLLEKFPEVKINKVEGFCFTNFSKDIRKVMMEHKGEISHATLYNLFRAIWTDAWETYGEGVLSGKEFLLTDRWLLSTAVYQDADDRLTNLLISSTNALPGLTILLTASANIAYNRIESTRPVDKFEEEYRSSHDTLQKRFIEKVGRFSGEHVVINTDNLSKEDVADAIRLTLDKYFGSNNG